jgi:GT2 family glycosyltransferase
VAVIIVNFNGGEHLRRCLDAVAAQTLRPQRVIVVDNASSDNSLAGLAERHPAIEIVRLENNVGFAAANNLAVMRAADVAWAALLNSDAFPQPRWLESLIAAAARHPETACFGSRLLEARDPSRFDGVGELYHVSGSHWRAATHKPAAGQFLEPQEVFWACAAAALYQREKFLEVGGFDESYFCYVEDVDLAFRFQLAGYSCRYVPEAVVEHVGSASAGRHSDFQVYYGQRNVIWTWFKNMPGPLLWCYLPQHLAWNLAACGRYLLRGQGRVIWKSKLDALRGLRVVWQQRRHTQLHRQVSCWELRQKMARGWFRPYLRWVT